MKADYTVPAQIGNRRANGDNRQMKADYTL